MKNVKLKPIWLTPEEHQVARLKAAEWNVPMKKVLPVALQRLSDSERKPKKGFGGGLF